MTCEVCLELLSAYIDEQTDEQERAQIRVHIDTCDTCARTLKALEEVRDMTKDLPVPELPDGLHEKMMEAVRREAKKRGKVKPAWIGVAAAAAFALIAGASLLSGGIGIATENEAQYANYAESAKPSMLTAKDEGGMRGYGTAPAAQAPSAAPAPAAAAPPMVSMSAADGARNQLTAGAAQDTSAPAVTEQKIIYTAHISMESTNFDADLAMVEAQAQTMGAHIEQSNVGGVPFTQPGGYGRYANMTIRVPAENYGALTQNVRGVGQNGSFSSSTSDITMSYMDNQARLSAYRTQMDKMNELIQKSDKIEDILMIQTQVTELLYKIESIEGQLRYQDNQVAYSTVTVSIQEVQKKDVFIQKPETLGDRSRESLYQTLNRIARGFENLVVGIVGFAPVLLPLIVIIIIALILIRGHSRKRKG